MGRLSNALLGLVFVAGAVFFFTFLSVLLWAPHETALDDLTSKLVLAGLNGAFIVLVAMSILVALRSKEAKEQK